MVKKSNCHSITVTVDTTVMYSVALLTSGYCFQVNHQKFLSLARLFIDSCPHGRKGPVTPAYTFGTPGMCVGFLFEARCGQTNIAHVVRDLQKQVGRETKS